MKTRTRLGAVGASLALAATAAGFAMTSAGATVNDINSNLSGGLNLTIPGDPPTNATLDVPSGSTFIGNFDDSSGALTGNVGIEAGSTTVPFGDTNVELQFRFENGGPITDGSINDAGDVHFVDTETIFLTSALGIPLGDDCKVGPVELTYDGTYDGETVDVSSDTVDVPALQGACGGLASTIAPLLAGATVSANLSFGMTVETIDTTTTTIPTAVEDETHFNGEFTTDGCDATLPIHFADAGDYTVQITTTNDRVIGSTDVNRTAGGDADVIVSVDPNHGTAHGDPLNAEILDSNGNLLDVQNGEVDDPTACAPTPSDSTKPLAQSNTPAAATPVSATPAYTG